MRPGHVHEEVAAQSLHELGQKLKQLTEQYQDVTEIQEESR